MIDRLERIRNRMRAVAQGPAPTTEVYRALFEVIYAELDSIITDEKNRRDVDQDIDDSVGPGASGFQGCG